MTSLPIHYLLPIYPGFQLLDLAGPLDILNILSTAHLDPEKHPLSLTFIAETLEPVPTKPIPPKSANWTFDLVDAYPSSGGKTNLSFNEYLQPDTTFADFLRALELDQGKPHVDVLLIPGGVGTRLKRVHPDGNKTSNIQSLLEFLPMVAPHIRTAIITVCTGSDALAQTGLLDNRRATTNMTRFKEVAARSPKVKWADFARWVRRISAGMDVTLAFISHFYGGQGVARSLAKALEYDWREIAEGERDPLYAKHFAT
ncbi:hypothetical protein G647_03774 [Cladophialophora carrionii CBS 160.54]|uniref:DJ-1/PfpI domain-containing protein n=1 Tax=Cladophialophora carrionii CBS 160.54 TaxID=1279043 RepID=V9DC41_9EURO|nr:uncharacterized protein G647_03774 [Cladophialophora carrionii CBS 160.54]ETI24405.1 hypothetical protein G647_03774 [Cladophialophora carrionii CBS 160.54]